MFNAVWGHHKIKGLAKCTLTWFNFQPDNEPDKWWSYYVI